MSFNALLVEDSQSLGALYSEYLRAEGGRVTHVHFGEDALAELEREKPDLLFLDIKLPDMSGMDILERVAADCPSVTVIMMTAHGTIDIAVDAMRLGAFDFLVKPFDAKRLGITVRNALKQRELLQLVSRYEKSLPTANFCGFIGESLAMQAVYRTLENVADSKASVFITGESGTGKEVCAQAIHSLGRRKEGPFIALNCASIPRELMESEIFGHVKGAFTGATSGRQGAAGRAHGGTLFLDEICEMDLDLQAKLLRFIQTGVYTPVGGGKEETVDVRFVAATNRHPWQEVKAGRFREDLYYRLYVIPVELPPLRSRGKDVQLLAKKLLKEYSREEGKAFKSMSADCMRLLSSYAWPGNVRQLQNVMRQMVVLNQGDTLTEAMLPEFVRGGHDKPRLVAPVAPAEPSHFQDQGHWRDPDDHMPPDAHGYGAQSLSGDDALASHSGTHSHSHSHIGSGESAEGIKPLWLAEKEIIEQAIEACEGNIPKAAALLDISASTIYRKRQAWEEAQQA